MSELTNLRVARKGEAGFSFLQMLIAMLVIGVVTTYGFISIKNSKRDMELAGEIRLFSNYLAKARVEAVRRRTSVTAITITSNSAYTVTLDSNYDGTISSSEIRAVTLPTGVTFTSGITNYPATISYDLKGRETTTNISGSTLTMSNANGTTTTVTMTGGGDLTLDTTVTGPATSTNLAPTAGTIATNTSVKSMN
jgi:Tfp pilus assembly protein FimT